MMKSCIYEGQVRHRRFAPRSHEFSYGLYLMYIDLDELPGIFDRFWFWSARRFNLAWFRREDHMGDATRLLKDVVREKIETATEFKPLGPIRLLTHFRYFGYGFNPVSFYYCFDEQDEKIETIVCEVNNTPWGEQHLYVLPRTEDRGQGDHMQFLHSKEFHVSPFMPMDIDYDWRFTKPSELLNVHMENYRQGLKLFDATLTLERTTISSFNLARILVQYPWVTAKVVVGIYFEALRLWLKKTPLYSHPDKKEAPEEAKST
jgi:uncharacterized protein